MKQKHVIVIVVAIIQLIGVIGAAIIGVAWGKSNVTVVVQLDGRNVLLNDADVQAIASENEELRNQISSYEEQVEILKNESKDLATKLGAANGELNEVPVIKFENCGLAIDGDEKVINKDKSYVEINGRQYYSKEFVDNLVSDNASVTMKDEMLYIGKIVKEKTNLFGMPVIEREDYAYFWDSIKDTYGNVYSNAIWFKYSNNFVTFNAKREYTYLKCIVAMQEGCNGKSSLQIIADDNIIYTSSEITNMTEPFEIDIPINQASKISIGTIGDSTSQVLISNAILYNQE